MTDRHDEIQHLREAVKRLEAELERMRTCEDAPAAAQTTTDSDEKSSEKKRIIDSAKTVSDEMNRLTRGFAYSGLESLSVSADAARFFVDKVSERNSSKDRKSATKQMMRLPWDMAAAFVDTLEEYANKNKRVVDKFYQKYNED